MTEKQILSFKKRLIHNIEKALLQDYPDYWLDALSFALACVQESYPNFNSMSTVDVQCPISGIVRPVSVHHLYNGSGVDACKTANARRAIKIAQKAEIEKEKKFGYTEAQLEARRINGNFVSTLGCKASADKIRNEGKTEAQLESCISSIILAQSLRWGSKNNQD